MSAQQFLMDQIGRARRVIEGADYDYDLNKKPSKPSSKPNPYSAKPNKGNFSGQSRNVFDTIKDKIKSMPGSQPAKPNPYAAKPTGQLTQKNAGSLLGPGNMTVGGAVTAPLILGGSEDASRKWSRLGYSSPEAYQKAVSQNANRERPISSDNPVRPSQPEGEDTVYAGKFADLRGSVTPGSNQPAASNLGEGASMDAAERYRAGAGYPAGVTRPGDYPVAFVPDSTLKTGGGGGNRDNSRVVPGSGGMVQKGTDMGRSFNDLLATTNTSGYQPYSSNQLPGTASNPFSGTAPKTQSFATGAESYTGNSLANFGGDGSEAFAQSRETTGNDTFNPNATRIEGGSSRKKGGSLAEALADKEGINSYMSKFSSGDQERAANRAFLDTEGSMAGLRAKEAVNGVVYAGGQHYGRGALSDDAGIGDKYKIDRADARGIASGKTTAAGLLDTYKSRITEAQKVSTPVEYQAPTYLEQGAQNGAFQQDKPMFSGSTPAIGGAVEFVINNDQTLPTFGALKGYKPQSIYKDPSFPNPFLK